MERGSTRSASRFPWNKKHRVTIPVESTQLMNFDVQNILKQPGGSVTYEQLQKTGLTDEHILRVAREMNTSQLMKEAYRPFAKIEFPEDMEFKAAVETLHSYLHS